MKLYKTKAGIIAVNEDRYFQIPGEWDALINRDDLFNYLLNKIATLKPDSALKQKTEDDCLAPIGDQEIWAAGVTYRRSKDARMEESKDSGASSFYDLVYDAYRPELFFKSTAARASGHNEYVYIRKDSRWNVPEPELTLFVNSAGRIQGYTIGNDMSSRSIEGENPLYLPQAKTYQRSAAIGPCLYLTREPISQETNIFMEIVRREKILFSDSVQISKMKRAHTELVSFLYRETDFPKGCFLMTGTCLVPSDDFTLEVDDIVKIRIDGIGMLSNTVAVKPDC